MVVSDFRKTILDDGLTVVTEHFSAVRSVSVGVWVKTGTRFETRQNNGIAHLLEHMMFKGTERRTPLQIARSLEAVGGNLNAFTSKELTCYYAEILDEHLRRAIDVLSDILCCSTFSQKELKKERTVILDEIHSLEDMPDELIQDIFVEKLFPENGLGLPILGTATSVARMTRDDILSFYRSFYFPENIVVAAAGNVNHDKLVKLCEKYFRFPNHKTPATLHTPRQFGQGEIVEHHSVNQAHVCMGAPGLPYGHPRRYDLLVLNTILGGGMSSRLFQNIRENHGLAYSIYSFLDFYYDTGLIGIYLGTEKKNLGKAIKLLEKELAKLRKKPIGKRELKEAQAQLKGNLMLSLESTARRMTRIAKSEIYLNKFQDIDIIIENINRVSQESLYELTKEILQPEKFLRIVFISKN